MGTGLQILPYLLYHRLDHEALGMIRHGIYEGAAKIENDFKSVSTCTRTWTNALDRHLLLFPSMFYRGWFLFALPLFQNIN